MTSAQTSDLEYKFEILYADTPNKRFIWSVVGPCGGIHIWGQFIEESSFGEKCYGGIEIHSNNPLYGDEDEPSQKDCWLIKGPCWHDGSSLYFSENIQPLIESYENEPGKITDSINSELKSWYENRLEGKSDE